MEPFIPGTRMKSCLDCHGEYAFPLISLLRSLDSLVDPCLPALRIFGTQFLLAVRVSLIMCSPSALCKKVLWL